jgi:cytoskeletal protein CcmA (bactofilin family)
MAQWNQSIPEEQSEKPVEKPQVMPPPVQSAPILQPKPYIASARAETVFGSGVTIEGEIEGDSNVRIGGKFKGEIKIEAELNIEKGAHLGAKIHAANVTIGGEVEGNVISTGQVKLLESGQLIGDLNVKTLTVAAGSRMRGHVEFGWSAVEEAKFLIGRARDDKIEKNGNVG